MLTGLISAARLRVFTNSTSLFTYTCKFLQTTTRACIVRLIITRIEPRFDEVLDEQQKLAALANGKSRDPQAVDGTALEAGKQANSLNIFRNILQPSGVLFLACGNFNRDNAPSKIKSQEADLVAMGRHFISNPDLAERLQNGWPLNPYDRTTFYGADPPEKGYNDYPFYKVGQEVESKA
jgi:2,4-dienoyl-CoA reductase-like NADH-dependent reductase (Old Yellow Enzyme family)